MPSTLATAKNAAEVRKALVRGLQAERREYASMDLRSPARAIARIQARAIAAAHRDQSLIELDRNGVTVLEVKVMRAVAEVLLRSYWPSVGRMYVIGSGKTALKIRSVDGLGYDELISLYDSIHARLAREAITNAAWRLATATLHASRKVPRGL